MTFFKPGKIQKTVTSHSGLSFEFRWIAWDDFEQLTKYVNTLSQEDTYISFSGETISKAEEADFLGSSLTKCQLKEAVYLTAYHQDHLIGLCGIKRVTEYKKRGHHLGSLSISLAEEFRGQGIGFQLAQTTIETAAKHISGLKMVLLSAFDDNQVGKKLYQKLGFKEWGRLPAGIFRQGQFSDHVFMYLPVNEFNPKG